MSGGASRLDWRLLLATAMVWLSIWAEVLIRDRYHDLLAQVDNMAWLVALPIIALGEWGLCAVIRLARGAHRGGVATRGNVVEVRYFLLAVALWLWIVPWNGAKGRSFAVSTSGALLLWGGLWIWGFLLPRAALTLSRSRWPAALSVAAVLFVALPPTLVALRSPLVYWPGNRVQPSSIATLDTPSVSHGAQPAPTVLVLLLDELSAQAAGPIRDALLHEGLAVVAGSVAPVSDSTAKVIPAMWLRRPFGEAKPCSGSAICSGMQIMNFSRVEVDWPDVDVVGFYHPYCAMRGLRSCRREAPPSAWNDPDRIACAVRRRLGLSLDSICHQGENRPWVVLVDRVEQAYWEAPFWKQGGMLFAHLPEPHPPALDPDETLAQHYATGVARGAILVAASVRRLRASGHEPFRIVITSDHPLRVNEWCSNGTYSALRCAGADRLKDTAVPLIVGSSDELPSLAPYHGNEQLFDLVTDLRARAP